jgi:serine/threonine-protein kinase
LRDLLPILSFIHSKGIIHRDIKPENIILRDPDRKPVLIDFGAVRETVQTVVSTGGNTRSIVIGTPGFMSMEQNIGRPLFASDIYSLGMTVIYAVTGRLPSQLPNDPTTGIILWQNFAPQISAPLKAILDRSIQPDAKDRYMNANVMNEALNAIAPAANFAAQRGTVPQFDNPPPPPPVPATVAVAGGNQNYPPQQNNNYNNNYNNNSPPAPYNNSPYQNQLPQSAVRQGLNWPLVIAIVAGTLFVGLVGIVGLLIFIGSQVPDEVSPPSSSPSSQNSQPRESNPSSSDASSPDSSDSPDPSPFASRSSSPSSSPSAASQSDALQNFTLKNNTRTAIQEVHISTNEDENWGPNRLTGVDSIPARGSHKFNFTGFTECLFDIRVVFADGDKSEKRGVDLCKIGTFNVNE